ncbi:MAG TPA: PepSY-associated TM helix domain-containing protein, partial [Candidatus Methylacidiphilales bacterium]
AAPPAVSPEAALAAAVAALPDLKPSFLALPRLPDGPYQIYGQTPGALFSHPTCSSVSIDAATGAAKQVKDFRKLRGFDKFLALLTPLHFGNFGGWPIRVIYCLGGLAPAVLSVSGVAIWIVRKRNQKRNGTPQSRLPIGV